MRLKGSLTLIRNRPLFDRPLIHIKACESRSPKVEWLSGEHPRAGGPDRTNIAPRHLFRLRSRPLLGRVPLPE
jgi:hypothetical protein